MYSILGLIRSSMASSCPLCGLSARGGELCAGCHQDVQAGAQSENHCLQCGERLGFRCLPRKTSQRSTITLRCDACLRVPPAFDRTVFAIEYAYPQEMLIRGLKERGRLEYSILLGNMLWRAIQTTSPRVPALQALVPIPSGQTALSRRGFNPAAELARALSKVSGVTLQPRWLTRTRDSEPLKTLSQTARRESVVDLYRCQKRLPPIWIGVVDDVMTTGSTMQICAQALLQAGAAGVVALAVARTPAFARTAGLA